MFNLRDYQAGDEGIVLEIVKEALAVYGLKIDPKTIDADIQDIQASYINRGGAFRILMKAEDVIGCYGLYKFPEESYELRKMYLLPQMKGQGLGRLLMNDCLDQAKQLNARRIILETNDCLHEAVAMYKKYGFTEYIPDHLSSRCSMGMELILE